MRLSCVASLKGALFECHGFQSKGQQTCMALLEWIKGWDGQGAATAAWIAPHA